MHEVGLSLWKKELESADAAVRLKRLKSLSDDLFHGEQHEQVLTILPTVIQLLNDKEDAVRDKVCRVLGHLGSPARAAVPSLLGLLDDPVVSVRESGCLALGQIGEEQSKVIPALLKCLEDNEPKVQTSAAMALGGFGEDAKAAVEPILQLILQPDEMYDRPLLLN
jgi:HEAT repeat protein